MQPAKAGPLIHREDGEELLVRMELSASTLGCLLAAGHLCAADFRCLDCESKNCVWRICLMNCMKQGDGRGEDACPCENCGRCDRRRGAGPQASRAPGPVPVLPVNDEKKRPT